MSLDIDSMTTLIQLIGVFTFEKLRLFNLEIVQILHWNNVKTKQFYTLLHGEIVVGEIAVLTALGNCC